ncbi:MAG TPA: STAS domain-containing protein [Holophaga sp.]|nr:STAS domain-containing protein [Holophaga sp.]HPS67591.1 STAS domain-containing protein [Holophaga sp.]
MADLSIQVHDVDGIAVVQPEGFVNAHTVRQFESALEELARSGRVTILLDCEHLNYISSAGLGAIMGLIEPIREQEGDILLCNLQRNVRSIFETLGFTQLYRVFSSREEALRTLAGKSE